MGMSLTQKREYRRKYYQKNKERCQKYQKEYQEKYRQNEEAMKRKKEYMKEYIKNYAPKWHSKPENKEKRKGYMKKYQEKNKERLKQYQKDYYSTPKGRKMMRIANWKQIGIEDEDLNSVYDVYIKEKTCWICGCEYKKRRERHLDHDHQTGEIRYICCRSCNINLLANAQEKGQMCKQ
jgi:hypothetical protein